MKKIRKECLPVGAILAVLIPALAAEEPVSETKALENAMWKLEFSPMGGRVQSIYSKVFGFQLTTPKSLGTFLEEDWKRRKSHEFLWKKPFEMNYADEGGVLTVKAAGQFEGGDINFLKVEKTYRAYPDSTAFRIDYRFNNTPEAMALQNYAPQLNSILGVEGREVTCFYPSTEGIDRREPGKRANEYWGTHVSRGWMAASTEDTGTGVAITMPFGEVSAFYSWFMQTPTLEWRMTPVGIAEGGHHDVSVEVIPFTGIYPVSGAGGGFVGSLDKGVCRIVSSRAGKIAVKAEGEDGEKAFEFAKPGDRVEFRTAAKTVRIMKDGREACVLFGRPDSGEWVIPEEGERRRSSVKEADLAAYTNYAEHACIRWARPLPTSAKPRVAILGGAAGGNAETGMMLERCDFDFHVMGIGLAAGYPPKPTLGNPIFSDGDNFSLINCGDVERCIIETLKRDADVIVLAGVPWEVLPKEAKKIIAEKVKGGIGFVAIGQARDIPELGYRLAKAKCEKRAVVRVASKDNPFAAVPFAVFGEEPVYAMTVPEGGVEYASCKDRAYAVESKFGKGTVINLQYCALQGAPQPVGGVTAAYLSDFYEDHVAPAEYYYSLVAKAIMRAAGRSTGLRLGTAEVNAVQARIRYSSTAAGEASINWRIREPFGGVVAQGVAKAALKAGEDIAAIVTGNVPEIHGRLVFEAEFRAPDDAVLDWGAWEFANEPKAFVKALKPAKGWLEEGETLEFEVGLEGVLDGCSLRSSLIDSYARTLDVRCEPASAKMKGAFSLSNALPSRCNTLVAELVDAKGAVISKRQAEIRVRPTDEKLAWNDYEVQTWASATQRRYLWPELAKIFHRIGISTLIANPHEIEGDFTMRYNINPTHLHGSGLSRSPEPKEYGETGDKMKLARGCCLSSAKFLEGRDKSIAGLSKTFRAHGYRYVWFGDEQSITGYGGQPIDFCFSPDCLREMRSFAKAKYGTLERLNEEWETEFRTWDEVVPFTRQEVWATPEKKHVAGWADHLEFMDGRLTNALARSVLPLRKLDSVCRYSISGTQAPSAYGGNDYWKQLGILDSYLSYGTGGQHDIHRSFLPEGGYLPWGWGYGGKGPRSVLTLWITAFNGCRGVMGFQQTSQLNSDWSYSQGLRDTLPTIRRLVEGTGRHFVQNLVSGADIAILYSQASFRAAFIEETRKEHEQMEERVRRTLMSFGYGYDYVAYEQLERGVLAERAYKALILPDSIAMSDGEVAAVKSFAAKGGRVFALGKIATRRQNCRLRDRPALEGVPRALDALDDEAWDAELARAGVAAAKLSITADGARVKGLEIRVKSDRAGNPVWCIAAPSAARTVESEFAFPRSGFVYDLVAGKAYGKVSRLKLPVEIGSPYALALYDREIALAKPVVEGAKATFAFTAPVDGVVRVRVYRPDGTEAECYAKNLDLRAGRGEYEIPFAISDPKGMWKIAATSVFDSAEAYAVLDMRGSAR